jgi:hypothetical protein
MKEDSEMLTNSVVNQRSYFITVGNIKMDFLNLGRLINVKDIGLELGSFCLIAKKLFFLYYLKARGINILLHLLKAIQR